MFEGSATRRCQLSEMRQASCKLAKPDIIACSLPEDHQSIRTTLYWRALATPLFRFSYQLQTEIMFPPAKYQILRERFG